VIGAETAYARKLGIKLKQPAIDDIAAIEELRQAIAAVVAAAFVPAGCARTTAPASAAPWASRRVPFHEPAEGCSSAAAQGTAHAAHAIRAISFVNKTSA